MFWGDCCGKGGRRDEGTSVAEEGLTEEVTEEAVWKRRRGQRGLARAATTGEQRGSTRKRLGNVGGRRNGSAGSVGREEAAAAGKSGRRRPIDGERLAIARMVNGDEGGRQ
ncbi:hypothetical protein BHM03_00041961 [Ensete ventricosum]|nr:hypothetical protein BHM03_00041961 [Ensete ventricosum]